MSAASSDAVWYRRDGSLVDRLEDDRLQVPRDPVVELPRAGRLGLEHPLDQPRPLGRGERRPERGQSRRAVKPRL